MQMAEKIILLIFLFAGFFWLRRRARSIDLENRMTKAIFGVFILLPGMLIGEKFLLEQLQLGRYTDLLIKALAIAVTFPIIGFGFLKSGNAEEDQVAQTSPESRVSSDKNQID